MSHWWKGLAVLSVGLVATGCGSGTADRSSGLSSKAGTARDLTLQSSTLSEAQVASPVELGRIRPAGPTSPDPTSARTAGAPRVSQPQEAPEAAPTPAASPAPAASLVDAPVIVPARQPPLPVYHAARGAGRELWPGESVTLVPVSSGPSTASVGGADGYKPSRTGAIIAAGGGGHPACGPGGGGIGFRF